MADGHERVEFRVGRHGLEKATNERYLSGRLKPIFPSLVQGTAKEEEYIARMIRRDRELNWG